MSPPNDMVVDHKNGDILDNRRNNLRICSHIDNVRNRKVSKNLGKSIYKGVQWITRDRIWLAICAKVYIGKFKSEEEAAIAYNKKAIEMFGEFARLNIIRNERK